MNEPKAVIELAHAAYVIGGSEVLKIVEPQLEQLEAENARLRSEVEQCKMSELNWTTERPDFACVFVGREADEYSLWQLVWNQGEPPEDDLDSETKYFYLAWTEIDGMEWDDIAECVFDEYLVLKRLPGFEEQSGERI